MSPVDQLAYNHQPPKQCWGRVALTIPCSCIGHKPLTRFWWLGKPTSNGRHCILPPRSSLIFPQTVTLYTKLYLQTKINKNNHQPCIDWTKTIAPKLILSKDKAYLPTTFPMLFSHKNNIGNANTTFLTYQKKTQTPFGWLEMWDTKISQDFQSEKIFIFMG